MANANVIRDFIIIFLSVIWEAMPFVVLGAAIAGILEELTPRQAFAFMMAVSVFLLIAIFVPVDVFGSVEPAAAGSAGEGGTATVPLLLKIGLAIIAGLVALGILLRTQKLIDHVLAFLGRHRFLAIIMSALLGLIIPMCECGIVPVVRRLLRKGMPLSCCTAYMLAGPVINIVVLLSTYMAFAGMEKTKYPNGQPTYQVGGVGMVVLRGGLAWLVAVVTSLVVEWQYRRYGDSLLAPLARTSIKEAQLGVEGIDEPPASKPLRERLNNISETALHDFTDIMVFLVLGALLAATARIVIHHDDVEAMSRDHPLLAIGAMMGLAIALCLCSEADAFVAASFVALRPASKLAFLVFGPMLDLKLYMMYLMVYRQRLIWTIIPCVAIQVLVYSLIFHFVWEKYAPLWWGTTP